MIHEEPDYKNVWVFRTGGLGDFLLAVPLLKALRGRAEQLTLVTRRASFDLVREDIPEVHFQDSDTPAVAGLFAEPEPAMCAALRDAEVFSFLGEGDDTFIRNLKECGCRKVSFLKSRPTQPPHVAVQMFVDAGIPVPDGLKDTAWLMNTPPGGKELWIHPGSGSPRKNAPTKDMLGRALETLHAQRLRGVCIVLGEAERERTEEIREEWSRLEPAFIIEPGLTELRHRMEASAGWLIGNDSGVSHLAAMLGIALDVHFISTDPEIWRPLGPRVTVHRPGPARSVKNR